MVLEKTLRDVHDFWNTQACGTHYIQAPRRSREFYDRFRDFRYRTEWHLPELVPFAEARDRSVLEIGCGNGADAVTFARHGARYTGVDLTEEAVEATREHFRLLGLEGDVRVANAESLPFPDGSFDLVYSHGVLHHMPDPRRGIAEVHRLLRPGGRAVIMLYHRHSINYYLRILGYMRLRVLLHALGRVGRWRADRRRARHQGLEGVQGNTNSRIWELHYRGLLREGLRYLRADRFVHHATDGPECPFAYVYSRREARHLFAAFAELRLRVAHFPLVKYPLLRHLPRRIERTIASKAGWYLFIEARKPEGGR